MNEFEIPEKRAYAFRVISQTIKKATKEATRLSRLQRIVWWFFKRTPETKYWYVVDVETNDSHWVLFGDIVMANDGDYWIAEGVDGRNIQLSNMKPTLIIGDISQITIVGRSQALEAEKSHE